MKARAGSLDIPAEHPYEDVKDVVVSTSRRSFSEYISKSVIGLSPVTLDSLCIEFSKELELRLKEDVEERGAV